MGLPSGLLITPPERLFLVLLFPLSDGFEKLVGVPLLPPLTCGVPHPGQVRL